MLLKTKERKALLMNNQIYDILKDVSLLWMPITITFYGVISSAWGIPCGEPILATLAGLNAALGAVVKYYSAKYNKQEFDSEAVDDEDELEVE